MTEQDLFLTAETHWAAKAARGRIEAINASPNLHWLVQVEGALLSFDKAPSLFRIVEAAHEKGLTGQVIVKKVMVARKRPRPLLLLPWMRVRREAEPVLAIAAE